MTIDEAKKIVDAAEGYAGKFLTGEPACLDGYFSIEELEAIILLQREADAAGGPVGPKA